MSVRTKVWTREEYARLVAAGAFAPDMRVQLIDGEIVEMTPQGAAHATALQRLQRALDAPLTPGYHVRAQLPLALARDPLSEPEPDIAVVPGAIDDYRDHHPLTAVLLVEIADTSLEFDRTRTMAAYARAGVPEYWMLNLSDRRLEGHQDPDPQAGAYRVRKTFGAPDEVSPAAFPAARIPVSALLP